MKHATVCRHPFAGPWRQANPSILCGGLLGGAAIALLLALPAQASFVATGIGLRHSPDSVEWIDPLVTEISIREAVYGDGKWVALTAQGGGGLATSTDGLQWSELPLPWSCSPLAPGGSFSACNSAEGGRGIAFGLVNGNPLFVVVGDNNWLVSCTLCGNLNEPLVQVIWTSPDGVTWTERTTTVAGSKPLYGVAFGLVGGVGTFVAAGTAGVVVTSTDGSSWVEGSTSLTQTTLGMAWGNDLFVAVGMGNGGVGSISTSPDGVAWTGPASAPDTLRSVAWGNGNWATVGDDGLILASPDAVTWSAQTVPGTGMVDWTEVTFGGGRFVAVSRSEAINATSNSSPVVASIDGLTWTPRPATVAPEAAALLTVAYGGDRFFAFGFQGAIQSLDGLEWTYVAERPLGQQHAVASDGQRWVMVGQAGSIATSSDGRTWTARYSGECCNALRAVAYGAGKWVAVGDDATVLVSTDGIRWTGLPSPKAFLGKLDLFGVGFRPGQWMAVGEQGIALTSPDGTTWSPQTTGTDQELHGVAWGDDQWVAVGSGGTILASADGATWVHRSTPSKVSLNFVVHDGSAPGASWVAVGDAGSLFTSFDGATWSAVPTSLSVDLHGVDRSASTWVAGGGDRLLRSPDAAPGSWSTTTLTGLDADALASDRVPPLECYPATQVVGVGGKARVDGGGGRWPYQWTAPGGSPAGPSAGANITRTYTSPGTYSVQLQDSNLGGASSAECQVIVLAKAPKPPSVRCDYKVKTTAMDPALYNWQEIDPALGGPGTVVDFKPGSSWTPRTFAVTPGEAPFKFPFCGAEYSTFRLATSGHVCLDNSNAPTGTVSPYIVAGSCGQPNPTTPLSRSPVLPAIYGLWGMTGYCPQGSSGCAFFAVQDVAPFRVLVFEFKDAGDAKAGEQTLQLRFYESNGCIEVQYKNVVAQPGLPRTAAGYKGAGGTYQFFSHTTNVGWAHKQEAWRACPFSAMNDAYKVNEDVPLTFDVTSNDDGLGQTFQVTSWTNPAHGTLTRGNGQGDFTYSPTPDWNGKDSFVYTITGSKGASATARAWLDVVAVNDPPSFQAAPSSIVATPKDGEIVLPGWATSIKSGPAAAVDEGGQEVAFVLVANSMPAIFLGQPILEWTTPDPTVPENRLPTLRFSPSGAPGTSRVCFRPVDSGGDASATDSAGTTVKGEPWGLPNCIDITENAPPVAYFEPVGDSAAPLQAVSFDPCPAPAPRCSHDPDGAIVLYLWEFGDGASSPLASPRHAFDGPGTYTVRLTVWDNHGLERHYERDVVIAWPSGGPLNEEAHAARVPPNADAGANRTVPEGSHVTLVGSGGGMAATFTWTQVAGPAVDLLGAGTSTPTFTAPRLTSMEPVVLTFSLRVMEGSLESRVAYVVIHVVSANHPPIANAGPTTTQPIGARTTLNGTGSKDVDGDRLTYLWEQVIRPGELMVALENADGPTPTFTAPAQPGLLHFRLTVSDGKATNQDHVIIDVQSIPAPTLLAAPDQPEPVSSKALAKAQTSWLPFLLAAVGYLAVAMVLVLLIAKRRRAK